MELWKRNVWVEMKNSTDKGNSMTGKEYDLGEKR